MNYEKYMDKCNFVFVLEWLCKDIYMIYVMLKVRVDINFI